MTNAARPRRSMSYCALWDPERSHLYRQISRPEYAGAKKPHRPHVQITRMREPYHVLERPDNHLCAGAEAAVFFPCTEAKQVQFSLGLLDRAAYEPPVLLKLWGHRPVHDELPVPVLRR